MNKVQQHIHVDRKIAELSRKVNLFDLQEILDACIDQIQSIVPAKKISIYLLDAKEENLVLKKHNFSRLRSESEIPLDSKSSIAPHIFIQGKPTLVPSIEEYVKVHKLDIESKGKERYTGGSRIVVPLAVELPNDTVRKLGLVSFTEKEDFSPFTKYELQLAERSTDILATAIHNCYVMDKKLGGKHKELMSELTDVKKAYAQKDIGLDEARKRQAQMLPELPQIEDYDLDAYYSPMESIGGDFYDFIQISESEVGIVIGDVSGHGIEAAMVMSMAKHILNIYSKIHRSLSETLIRANEEILSSLKGEAFVAVFLGILNTNTHVLRYARAGQTYPIVYNPKRQADPYELKSTGIVLGTVRGEMFRSKVEEKHIQLQPGDTMHLYTDGLVEANNPEGEEFGLERIYECMADTKDQTTAEISKYLEEKVQNFTQAPQTDDLTILTLKAGEIKPKPNFNTQRLQKDIMDQAESFIISPDLSYDEDVQAQLLQLEEKIAIQESQIGELKKEKEAIEKRCQEVEHHYNLAVNDPDSLVKTLKDQLQIASELPRELIGENQKLHKELEGEKRGRRDLELEINHLLSSLEEKDETNRRLESLINQLSRNLELQA